MTLYFILNFGQLHAIVCLLVSVIPTRYNLFYIFLYILTNQQNVNMSKVRFDGINDLLKNISGLPTIHIHKAGLKDLHNLISTYLSQQLLASFLPWNSTAPTFPVWKCQAPYPTFPTPQNLFTQNDLQKKWYLSSFLFCFSFIWPSIWELLNNCLWEILLLRRLYNLFYQVLGQHPVSLLLITHSVITHLSVFESYPSYF